MFRTWSVFRDGCYVVVRVHMTPTVQSLVPVLITHTVLRVALMTATGAVPVLTDRPVLMLILSVVIGMAAGTVRLVGRRWP